MQTLTTSRCNHASKRSGSRSPWQVTPGDHQSVLEGVLGPIDIPQDPLRDREEPVASNAIRSTNAAWSPFRAASTRSRSTRATCGRRAQRWGAVRPLVVDGAARRAFILRPASLGPAMRSHPSRPQARPRRCCHRGFVFDCILIGLDACSSRPDASAGRRRILGPRGPRSGPRMRADPRRRPISEEYARDVAAVSARWSAYVRALVLGACGASASGDVGPQGAPAGP